LRRVRGLYPKIPVVVLSASDTAETVVRALDGGATGFIPKASKSDVMVNALRLVLRDRAGAAPDSKRYYPRLSLCPGMAWWRS
jgi:DNA-binding NarL/FixJ family response regulator